MMTREKATEKTFKIYYDVHIPEGRRSNAALPLLIAFHGYEGNKESMMAVAQAINSTGFAIASVQGPNAFFVRQDGKAEPRIGFGWMMRYKVEETLRLHHQTVLDVIKEVSAECAIDAGSVFLMGFSQSVALNYRFAFTHPNVVRGIVAVCGGIPGDWEEDKYGNSETDVLIIAGESDEFYPLERTRSFPDKLARRAKLVEFRSYPCGHVFPRESFSFINEWLMTRAGEA